MRTLLTSALLIMLSFGGGGAGIARPVPTPRDAISLRLVERKSSFAIGQPFQVQAEVKNVGDETVLVCRTLDVGLSKSCSWDFQIRDASGRDVPTAGMVGDRPIGDKEEFATALLKNWIALSPGYSYSAPIDVGLAFWPPVRPGRYQLKATLVSDGPGANSVYDDLRMYPAELARLPYRGWKGKVESNTITIVVRKAEGQEQ